MVLHRPVEPARLTMQVESYDVRILKPLLLVAQQHD
jgi:hypothetical protein